AFRLDIDPFPRFDPPVGEDDDFIQGQVDAHVWERSAVAHPGLSGHGLNVGPGKRFLAVVSRQHAWPSSMTRAQRPTSGDVLALPNYLRLAAKRKARQVRFLCLEGEGKGRSEAEKKPLPQPLPEAERGAGRTQPLCPNPNPPRFLLPLSASGRGLGGGV